LAAHQKCAAFCIAGQAVNSVIICCESVIHTRDTKEIKMRIGIVLSLVVALFAIPAIAQTGDVTPGCQEMTTPNCAGICLTAEQWKRIVDYRQKKGEKAKWRPSICDSKSYIDPSCTYAEWTTHPCAKACSAERKGSYLFYDKSKWEGWGSAYACQIK